MYVCLRVKYALFLSDFVWKLNFPDRFSKNTQISNFMKIRPVGAELFHVSRRIDRHDEPNSRFWKFLLTLIKISIDYYSKLHSKMVFVMQKLYVLCKETEFFGITDMTFWLRSVMSWYIRIVRSLTMDLMTRLWFPSVVETQFLYLPCAQGGCGTHWTPTETILISTELNWNYINLKAILIVFSLWCFTWRQ
jgi:hypothetical protein